MGAFDGARTHNLLITSQTWNLLRQAASCFCCSIKSEQISAKQILVTLSTISGERRVPVLYNYSCVHVQDNLFIHIWNWIFTCQYPTYHWVVVLKHYLHTRRLYNIDMGTILLKHLQKSTYKKALTKKALTKKNLQKSTYKKALTKKISYTITRL